MTQKGKRPRCGAKIRGSDPARYCQRYPVPGRKRCKLHGGETQRGVESANYKHGLYSKHMPANLLAHYEEALRTPEALSLHAEMALERARISESIEEMTEAPADRRHELFAMVSQAIDSLRKCAAAERRAVENAEGTLRLDQVIGMLQRILGKLDQLHRSGDVSAVALGQLSQTVDEMLGDASPSPKHGPN